ncbi:MAG TPA: 30S ribosomal protein S19 [Candidatus Nanoarchaeia archaeon]|nr:30S ribosomal protein S19 [Candidatus Nanoarchaeia archaeon]
MAQKVFTYRGKTLEELNSMSIAEFAKLVPSRQRRSLTKGFTDPQKKLLAKLRKGKNIETHCRTMIILPEMVNRTIKVHDGRNFVAVIIQPDMLGHVLGEFVLTRKPVRHSAPGIGATKSSAAMSVK